MPLLINEVHRNISADGIELLSSWHILLELNHIPSLTNNRVCSFCPCFLNCARHNFRQELLHAVVRGDERADGFEGVAHGIMCVPISASRHHKSFAAVVHDLRLALFNESFGTRLVTHIDEFAVFHSQSFHNLIIFGCINLAINHKVGTLIAFAAGKRTRT